MSLFSETKKYFKNQKHPLRQRGQNFLIIENSIKKIVNTAHLDHNDTVLEIGAGTGNLTNFLLKSKRIIAIEIDNFLYSILKEKFIGQENIIIKNEDIRELKLKDLNLEKYKVIANIPFNITGFLIRKLLSQENKPELIVLIIQKQVAQRIVATSPNNSLLSISVKFFGQPEIVSYLNKNNFWPRPKVDSAILKIKPEKKYSINKDIFFKTVKAGFLHPRKYLLNNLSISGIIKKQKGKEIFKKIDLDYRIRAQELLVQNWVNLAKEIFKK